MISFAVFAHARSSVRDGLQVGSGTGLTGRTSPIRGRLADAGVRGLDGVELVAVVAGRVGRDGRVGRVAEAGVRTVSPVRGRLVVLRGPGGGVRRRAMNRGSGSPAAPASFRGLQPIRAPSFLL